MKVIPYGTQEISDEDIQAVVACLKSDHLTQGPLIEEFEKKFAQYIGANFAVAVSSGTAALHLATLALGVSRGQRVLTTPNTFVASANCVLYCGGDIEFVDIDPKTFCMDAAVLASKFEKARPNTYAGIVSVDFAGYPATDVALCELAKKHSLWILEDSCHALGAESELPKGWTKAGSCDNADVSIFSFHPVKHLATGEGGMICTNDAKIYHKLRLLRTHGITRDPAAFALKPDGAWHMEMHELGYNYRITDFQSALGISQLKRIDKNLERRRQIAAVYRRELAGLCEFSVEQPSRKHAYHLFVIQTPRRNELYAYLRAQNIHCQVHYIPVYRQPYYENRYGRKSLPAMEDYYNQALSLPMYHSLSDEQLEYVLEKVTKFLKGV